MNKVTLIGRLGNDPKFINFESGTKKASFSLATSETYKDKTGEKVQKTEWHNVEVWGKLSDMVMRYLAKGSLVCIEGKIKREEWDDKDGNKHSKTVISANYLKMLSSRQDNQSNQVESTPQFQDDLPF